MTPYNLFIIAPRYWMLAAFVLFSACGKSDAPVSGAKPGAKGGPPPPPVKLAALILSAQSSTSGLTATGSVLAEREVEIKTEISGKVVRIGFVEGAKVSTGQVLVKLDDAELRAQAERASARLLLAETQEKRLKEQVAAEAVSQREYDQARAELQTARADAALASSQLDKCALKAPFSGMSGLRQVELGSVVQPGTLITTVQDVSTLRVEFSVPERQASLVRTGLTVRFQAAGSPDTQSAVIYALEPRIDPATRLLRVRARCAKPGKHILPGSYAQVELPLSSDSALWIPTQAVVQNARGSMVWLARGGKAEARPFTPGLRTPESVEAAQGLTAGDTLLVSGLLQLRPGAPVIPAFSP